MSDRLFFKFKKTKWTECRSTNNIKTFMFGSSKDDIPLKIMIVKESENWKINYMKENGGIRK